MAEFQENCVWTIKFTELRKLEITTRACYKYRKWRKCSKFNFICLRNLPTSFETPKNISVTNVVIPWLSILVEQFFSTMKYITSHLRSCRTDEMNVNRVSVKPTPSGDLKNSVKMYNGKYLSKSARPATRMTA
jgi:hypothetical protein